VTNKEAISVAFSPLVDEKGLSTIGISFAERPYVPILQRTLKPMLSEVIMGKVGEIMPRALMLAPVIISEKYNGYVFGVLDFSQLQNLFDANSGHKAIRYTVVDRNNNVIMSNRSDQKIMEPFVRLDGTLNRLDAEISQWIPAMTPYVTISERWKQSSYVVEATVDNLANWKLILEQPLAPYQGKLYHNYACKLSLLFFILLGALVLAELLSRRFIATIDKLCLITQDLPIRLMKSDEKIAWPESGMLETNNLIRNFSKMATWLRSQFEENRQINKSLELRVVERTAELTESKERYRSILDASPVPMAINDEQQNISYLNPAFVQTFGYTLEDIPTLAHWWPKAYPDSVYRQEVTEAWQVNFDAAKQTGSAFSPLEVIVRCKDLTDKTVLINAASISNKFKGEHLVMLYDITERKRAEEENNRLQLQLLQAQKMESVGTLAGGIAHDFNNILGAIMGFTEIAKDTIPQESFTAKNLNKVMEASQRAAGLVKQILSFSRQEKIKLSPLDPARIVQEALKLLRASIPSTIEIIEHINTKTRPILADPTQVHQILINLCTNACHAMEQTGGILDITLNDYELLQDEIQKHPEVQPGGFVVLTISDTGSGIEPDIWGRIFDPYFTTKEVGKGSGMGLSIVHGIVTSYGGFITSENKFGGGTVFRVFFPAIEQEVVSEVETCEVAPSGTERILLVDDEEILADLGEMMLGQLGYAVTALTRSSEALVIFQQQPDSFDVVITDQTMPDMTGIDFARKLWQIRPGLPIILCTGYSTLINEEQAKAAGFKGFAMKPLSKQVIATLLRKVLDESRKES